MCQADPGQADPGKTRAKSGFSMIELVMAIFVLAFGVLGLAETTLFVTRQLTLAEVTTARAVATQSVMERLHATVFDSIAEGGDTIGAMIVSWTVTANTVQSKALRIVTLGPGQASMSGGLSTPTLSSAVADTINYRVLRP